MIAQAEAPRWEWARTPWKRLRGLAGRLPDTTVLVFPHCHDVHTFTMRYPLDIAFLDRDGKVLQVHRQVPPGLRFRCKGAWQVIERFALQGCWYQKGDLVREAAKSRRPFKRKAKHCERRTS